MSVTVLIVPHKCSQIRNKAKLRAMYISLATHNEITTECILTCICNLVLVNPSWKRLVESELIDIIECMLIHYFRSMHFIHPNETDIQVKQL